VENRGRSDYRLCKTKLRRVAVSAAQAEGGGGGGGDEALREVHELRRPCLRCALACTLDCSAGMGNMTELHGRKYASICAEPWKQSTHAKQEQAQQRARCLAGKRLPHAVR